MKGAQLLQRLPSIALATTLCVLNLWAVCLTAEAADLKADIAILAAEADAIQAQRDALNAIPQKPTRQAFFVNTLKPPKAEFVPMDIPLTIDLQEHIHNEASRIGIEPEILFNLIYRESRFQINAYCIDRNRLESVGLCQINATTFDFLSERGIDWTTPEGNITAAVELIAYYRDERGCTLLEALAAYGAGFDGMKRGQGLEAAKKLLEIQKGDYYGEIQGWG